MGRAQLVIFIVSALLAAALTGVGTYADSHTAYAQEPVAARVASDDDRPAVLDRDAAPWWWAGAGAVLLVGAGLFRRVDPDRRDPGAR